MNKKVLCFGDSNVFGAVPGVFERYNENERWSGALKELLKEKFDVIEAGCNNRTCFCDNPQGFKETGYKALEKYLNKDIDIAVFPLGINDLQFAYNVNLNDFELGLEKFINISKNINQNLKIILVCPSIIKEGILNSFFASMFDETSIEKSKKLIEIYEKIAQKYNCILVDMNKIAQVSSKDGLHYEKDEHKKIAKYFYDVLINL